MTGWDVIRIYRALFRRLWRAIHKAGRVRSP